MTRKLAFSSIMTALTIVCLYGSVALPTGRIALLAITSLCILITHAECGTKFSLLQFFSSALLGILLVPFKLQMILFVAFIGYYPIVKSYIERIGKTWLEWIVKILFFNAVLIIAYFILTNFLMTHMNLGVIFDIVMSHLLSVVVLAEIVFILYDYMLSLLASYYVNVIQKRLKLY